jgi:hypothetical protein
MSESNSKKEVCKERLLAALKNKTEFVYLCSENHDYLEMARHIASSPETPKDIIYLIFCNYCLDERDVEHFSFKHMRRALASNKSISREIIDFLAFSSCETTKAILAKNENCPQDILEMLSHDSNFFIRCEVAEHKNTPLHVLDSMIDGKDTGSQFIKGIVATNQNISEKMAEKLMASANPNTRYALASNESTPKHIIEKLIDDESEMVRSVAQRHPCMKNFECFL